MRVSRHVRRGVVASLVVFVVAGALSTGARGVSAGPPPSFTTAMLPPAPNLGLPHNEDGEPGLAVDGGGTTWIASDIAPYATDDPRSHTTGVLSGADVWRSTDHGQSYQWVAAPFNGLVSTQAGAGGEDTDIAAATVKNSNGFYDIWVASLWVGSTNLAVSQDGGATWTTVPVNGEPVQDRPWLAASGACSVYLSYHAIAPYDTVVDQFSLPPCNGQSINSAVPPTQATLFAGNIAPGLTNRFGKLVVDNSPSSPHLGNVYQPMQGCDAGAPNPSNPQVGVGCTTAAQTFMGVSADGGLTWHAYTVHVTNNTTLYIWPDTAAVDSAGNVYIAWMEGNGGFAQNAFISVSKDGGQTWLPAVQVNGPPSLSAAYPTVAASTPGHVEVAWYGTTRNGGTADVNVMGQPATTANAACGAAAQPTCWQVWWASSTDYGSTFTGQQAISGTVHTGVLCVEGGGCGVYPGDRNLLDDFGLAIDPATGGALLAVTNDQPENIQGRSHTDFITQVVSPAANTPDLPLPALAVLVLAGAGLAGLGRRRRRAGEG